MGTSPLETSATLGLQIGRARRAPSRLWQAPIFLLGLLAFGAVAFTAPLRKDASLLAMESDIAALRRGLEPGAENPDILVANAENLLTRLTQFTRKAAEVHFLAGSAYFRQKEVAPPHCLAKVREKALQHLEEAFSRGVSLEDSYPLMYRLGVSLLEQGNDKEMRRAIEFMTQAIEKGADSPARGYALLVEAYLKLPRPDLEAALAASQKQLEMTDDRDGDKMANARLSRAELLLRNEQRPDAIKELERIQSGVTPNVRARARLLQARACAEEGWWHRAVPLWQDLLRLEKEVPGGKGRILYELGLAQANAEHPDLSAAAKAWQEAIQLGDEAGQAAGLRLGELYMFGPEADADKALDTWHIALSSVRSERDYVNPRVEIAQVRDWFDKTFAVFLERQDYARSEKLVDLYKKLAGAGQAEERLAQAAEGRAGELQALAKNLTGAEGKTAETNYRGQFHRAAVAYEQAAVAKTGPARTHAFWKSASCYLAAQDFSRAGTMLEKYLELEKDENGLAQGWYSLAEANLAQGAKDQARQAYYKCIEFPATTFAYRARYQLAVEEIEKKNFDQAKAILEQNLPSSPTMDREAREKSLYKLAGLYLQLNNIDKAAILLNEAWRQYPDNPSSLAAREQLADCYRKLADQAQAKMQAAAGDDVRAHHLRTRRRWLEQASETYQLLADDLETMSRKQTLDPAELNVQRRALFGAADTLYEQEDFSEALRRYQVLQTRYRKKVEGLIAGQRIWRCVGVMTDPKQLPQVRKVAADAVQNALADLETMPADSPAFGGAPGVWSKEDWTTWLRWVEGQLNGNPAPRPKTLF